MVKIGVVGCGKIAARHLAAYKKLGVAVAVCDVDSELAEARAKELGVEAVPRLEHLLEDGRVDGIDVCVPTTFHADAVMAGLRHDKHVFCEKPLAMTKDEALQIAAVQEDVGRTVMVGYLYRFYPAFRFVKETLDEGIIGDPYFAIFRLGGRGSAATWKHRTDQGGGAVLEMLVHKLDVAQWLFGEITQVDTLWKETILTRRDVAGESVNADAEDFVAVRLLAGKVKVLCQSDLVTPSYMNHVDIQGDNGSIFTSILHYLPTIVHCKEPRGIFNEGNNNYQFPPVNVFEQELAHFVDAIRGEREDVNDARDSVKLMGLVDQIRGAASATDLRTSGPATRETLRA